MSQDIRIPDIGDIETVEVIEICAAVGDELSEDDPVIVIESDKASMEVPAGIAGTLEAISVAVGDTVTEGDLIARISGVDKAADADRPAETGTENEPIEERNEPVAHPPESVSSDIRAPDSDSVPIGSVPIRGVPIRSVPIKVPDIGEAEDVVVIEVAVTSGDVVTADDLLVVVESDKASMEIPAGLNGTVSEVHVVAGDEVDEGTLLVTLIADADAEMSKAPVAPLDVAGAESPTEPAPSSSSPTPSPEVDAVATTPAAEAVTSASRQNGELLHAGPAVRRLARELGVDLHELRDKGTGSRGRLQKDDIKAYVKARLGDDSGRVSGGRSGGGAIPPVPQSDFSKFGPVDKEPISRIGVIGAQNLHRSWLNVPHVTQHEEADVTDLEEFRASLKEEAGSRGIKVTPLSFIVKACCHALKEFPRFNASLDAEIKNYILKRYYHIGFAVDTDDGLVVPVIRDADQLGIWELSEVIVELADKARRQKLGMTDLQGGTFSISSLGNIGGTGFTPIINAPEVAILGVSRLVTRPVWNGKQFEPRKMLPLSLSYDHRAVNGAEAGRFASQLASLLADSRRLAL